MLPQLKFQSTEAQTIIKKDLFEDAYVLYNVFSESECQQLIKQGEEIKFEPLPDKSEYRTNERIVCESKEFSEVLWSRVSPYVADVLTIPAKHLTLHTDYFTQGTWKKSGLNDQLRLCKYNSGNYFKAHFDEGYHPDFEQCRTLKTCMVYLNDNFDGGETVFYPTDDDCILLKPVSGMCLIFNQKIWHEGKTVISGLKYFIRTDIQYEKVSITEPKSIAFYHYAKAIYYEQQKNMTEAMKHYKLAFANDLHVDMEYYKVYG